MTRVLALALALGLVAAPVATAQGPGPIPAPAAAEADAEARLQAVTSDIAQRAASLGLSAKTVGVAFAGLAADPEVIELSRRQPEYSIAPWQYLGKLVSEQRMADGRAKLVAERQTLLDVEAAFGVDRHVVTAIWGIESNFGAAMGERRIVRSLATLAAMDERRGPFWRGELIAALRMIERGDAVAERMTGSWAGAMGHTQFIPSTYQAHAIDFDGDGRRDLWSTADALASTAKYLKASGWVGDRPCAFEVVLPPTFDHGLAAPGSERTLAGWMALGVKPAGADGPGSPVEASRRMPGTALSRVLLPAGARGPAFLVTQNFGAVLRYNQSVAYALAVCHLADRLSGGGAVLAAWPVDDPPLVRAEREELQRLLGGLGHDIGAVDGLIGRQTQAAIRAYQKAAGIPADGYASQRLLERLRRDARL
ncbi:MAG: lytic murein transglycosylase [Hyphomicrobiaceae bacterium]|jgi:membrane-bound lytic murein transglycosylase B